MKWQTQLTEMPWITYSTRWKASSGVKWYSCAERCKTNPPQDQSTNGSETASQGFLHNHRLMLHVTHLLFGWIRNLGIRWFSRKNATELAILTLSNVYQLLSRSGVPGRSHDLLNPCTLFAVTAHKTDLAAPAAAVQVLLLIHLWTNRGCLCKVSGAQQECGVSWTS